VQSVDPQAVAAAAAAQVQASQQQLLAAGFGAVSVMSKRGRLAPLRTVFYHDEGEGGSWGVGGGRGGASMQGGGGHVMGIRGVWGVLHSPLSCSLA
jgi:uncharacterized membrane protein YgcG